MWQFEESLDDSNQKGSDSMQLHTLSHFLPPNISLCVPELFTQAIYSLILKHPSPFNNSIRGTVICKIRTSKLMIRDCVWEISCAPEISVNVLQLPQSLADVNTGK